MTNPTATRTCPYCRSAVSPGPGLLACPGCHAIYHAECWHDNRGCSVLGCAAGPVAPDAAPPAR